MLRGTALAIVVAVITLGLSSATNLRNRAASANAASAAPQSAKPAPASANAASAAPQSAKPAAATVTAADSVIPQGAPQNAATIAPIIHAGDTPLGDGITATRSDSGVVVAFDTPDMRTRIAEKFERLLRETLPKIYGPKIQPALAALPQGGVAARGNLIYDLPTRGIRLTVEPGWHLDVFPEIRPGQDGPLVVRYRATIAKD